MMTVLNLIPKPLRRLGWRVKGLFSLLINGAYDLRRYRRHSATFRHQYTLSQLEGRLWALCHVVEKGFSLPQTRPGFGRENIDTLVDLMKAYRQSGYPLDTPCYRSAYDALKCYYDRYRREEPALGEFDA